MRGRGGTITAAVDVPGGPIWRGTINGVTLTGALTGPNGGKIYIPSQNPAH